MKIDVSIKWHDIWVGLFVDAKNRILYFCPLPMIVVKITLNDVHYAVYKDHGNLIYVGCCMGRQIKDEWKNDPFFTYVKTKVSECPVCSRRSLYPEERMKGR